jgi:hypothetical protein
MQTTITYIYYYIPWTNSAKKKHNMDQWLHPGRTASMRAYRIIDQSVREATLLPLGPLPHAHTKIRTIRVVKHASMHVILYRAACYVHISA